jgi:transglutaminase-like putative cysteine protease
MSDLVKRGKKQPTIREKATALVQPLAQKNYLGEIIALHQFVRDNIRYVRDIRGVETVHFPEQILSQEYGDCDDKAILLASLLESIGHPTRFVAVGFTVPDDYSHVFVDTKYGPGWMSLETTENVPAGWRPPGIVAALPWYN